MLFLCHTHTHTHSLSLVRCLPAFVVHGLAHPGLTTAATPRVCLILLCWRRWCKTDCRNHRLHLGSAADKHYKYDCCNTCIPLLVCVMLFTDTNKMISLRETPLPYTSSHARFSVINFPLTVAAHIPSFPSFGARTLAVCRGI